MVVTMKNVQNKAQKELLKTELEKFSNDLHLANRAFNTCSVESFNNSLTTWIDKQLKCNKESYEMWESFALLHFNNGEDLFKPLMYDLTAEENTGHFILVDQSPNKLPKNQMISKVTHNLVKLNLKKVLLLHQKLLFHLYLQQYYLSQLWLLMLLHLQYHLQL